TTATTTITSTITETKGGGITEEEDRERGKVKTQVYVDYVRELGGTSTRARVLTLGGLALATAAAGAPPPLQSWWLSRWTGNADQASELRSVAVFAALGALAVAAAVGRQLVWSERALAAGTGLHDRALRRLLGTSVRFFDANPVGRILN